MNAGLGFVNVRREDGEIWFLTGLHTLYLQGQNNVFWLGEARG